MLASICLRLVSCFDLTESLLLSTVVLLESIFHSRFWREGSQERPEAPVSLCCHLAESGKVWNAYIKADVILRPALGFWPHGAQLPDISNRFSSALAKEAES